MCSNPGPCAVEGSETCIVLWEEGRAGLQKAGAGFLWAVLLGWQALPVETSNGVLSHRTAALGLDLGTKKAIFF